MFKQVLFVLALACSSCADHPRTAPVEPSSGVNGLVEENRKCWALGEKMRNSLQECVEILQQCDAYEKAEFKQLHQCQKECGK